MTRTESAFDARTQKNIQLWLEGDFDQASKDEIHRLQKEDPQELIDAFYQRMSFGTGGLRGLMGVGTNRMNIYTVRAATQGLANYILKQDDSQKCVLIGYDSRHNSYTFAQEAAQVLAANNIEVFIYQGVRPVALVSYGVLYKKCIAGIMITASHNPPKYNGYKVYWSYGGQILPPHDQNVIQEVNHITKNAMVKHTSFSSTLIHTIDREIDKSYLHTIHQLQLHPKDNATYGKDLKVIYTNLHGAGITMVPPALDDWGFTNVSLVEEQKSLDGDFPTVSSPNPEQKEAMALGVKKLQAEKGDLLLGTDPDTDRLGVVVLHQNTPHFLSGNQLACILLEHICRSLTQKQQMPKHAGFIKTIVTTELFREIAIRYQGTCLDVLTGFKYIGEKIHQWEQDPNTYPQFIFGAEESFGYLLGTHARDKDAIIASTCVCEAALQLKKQNKTLVDFLYEIYKSYGVYREKLLSLTFEGKQGEEHIKMLMTKLRNHPPKHIKGHTLITIEDYLSQTARDAHSEHPLSLPSSDVLRFWLEDHTKIVIRPSGTEPKIKLYCASVKKHIQTDSIQHTIDLCDKQTDEILTEFKTLLF